MASTPHSPGGGAIIAGINVTPLVDVTLVLLIVFVVTAKLIVAPVVPLDLPRATRTDQVQIVFSIVMPTTGPTLVNGEPVTNDQVLVRVAREALLQNPDLRVVIQADGAVPHRRVIHTLDLVGSAGIARVAFGALPPDEAAR